MSTIKVTNIEHGSTGDGGIQLDNAGHVTVDGQQLPTAGALSNRNIMINGAMQVSQRSTSSTGQTGTAYRACDRYQVGINSLGTWTISQSSNSPNGFSNSLKIECTTASTSPGASAFLAIFYSIEAQDLQHLSYGTADAQPLTLSFYVRTNKTSSGSLAIRQRDNSDKLFSTTYSFDSSANTWKRIEISIPADTAGSINNDNGQGFTLGWWLNSGSDYTGGGATSGWESLTNNKRNAANAGIGGAVGDYFEITGVQLEVGSKATPFEHRSFGDELARCQRYYFFLAGGGSPNQQNFGAGTYYTSNIFATHVVFPVTMRSSPSLDFVSGVDYYRIWHTGTFDDFQGLSIIRSGTNGTGIDTTTGTGGIQGNGGVITTLTSAAYVAFSAEL